MCYGRLWTKRTEITWYQLEPGIGKRLRVREAAAFQVSDANGTNFGKLDAGEIEHFNVMFWSLRRTLR